MIVIILMVSNKNDHQSATISGQQPTLQASQQQHQQLVNPTIQTSLSVVMTPPSHENIVKSCHNVDDTCTILNDTASMTTMHHGGPIVTEATKSIAYQDLNSLLSSSSRKDLLTSLLTEQPNELFRLSSPRITSQYTNSMNKYKPVRLVSAAPIVPIKNKKLKWR